MSTSRDSIGENSFKTSHARFIHENFSVLITTPLDQIQQNLFRKEPCQTTAKPADIVLQTWFENYPTPRWGWVFLERTRILSWIQFTTHFIEFFDVETKQFVDIFVHVIMARQTCGQRSNKAAESKRRALENYFSERNCYMFLISKYRGDQDLGLCTTSVLAFGEPQRNGKIWFFLRWNSFFFPEVLPTNRFVTESCLYMCSCALSCRVCCGQK